MTTPIDLLTVLPVANRPTAAARLRRAGAVTLGLLAVVVLAPAARVVVASPATAAPPRAAPVAPVAPAAAPSDVVGLALASTWTLQELSLRPVEHGIAALSARLEGPPGRPALPDRLVAELAHPAVAGPDPVAITATARGTAVDVSGRVRISDGPSVGSTVGAGGLPAAVAGAVTAGGGLVRGVRTVTLEDGPAAAAVTFDAPPTAVPGILRALETGVSAPPRMTTLLVRRAGEALAVELVLTPRDPRPFAP